MQLNNNKIQQILDYYSVGSFQTMTDLGKIHVVLRGSDLAIQDPFTKENILLPKSLTVDLWIIHTTHGYFMMLSTIPSDEILAFTNLKNPLVFLLKKIGLKHVEIMKNFNHKSTDCHRFDRYFHLVSI